MWEEWFIFISSALPIFKCSMIYSIHLHWFQKTNKQINKQQMAFIQVSIYSRVTKSQLIKRIYSNDTILNWKKNSTWCNLGNMWLSLQSSWTNGRECSYSCLKPLANAFGFVWLMAQNTAVMTEGASDSIFWVCSFSPCLWMLITLTV
jgi:hypothetical protein